MISFFVGKVIYVFSPQPWNYLHLSKHHYARTLANRNHVYFINPPSSGFRFGCTLEKVQSTLEVVQCNIPAPRFLRFKFPAIYKVMVQFYLSRYIQKHLKPADAAFDFGCYQQFDSLKFVHAHHKIYFPVDDFGTLIPNARGADLVLTVSKIIQAKFPEGKCHFINHGLSEAFSKRANQRQNAWIANGRIRVGCSGNLFIRYLDTFTLMNLVREYPSIEFHFFGSLEVNLSVEWQCQWNDFLRSSTNVRLRGVLSPEGLASAYESMDMFLLCYKPDYVNYHGENSHKVLEYLSTGRVLVSTHLTIYANTKLLEMSPNDHNEQLIGVFSRVVSNLPEYNSNERSELRTKFALENTYEKQLLRIDELIATRLESQSE